MLQVPVPALTHSSPCMSEPKVPVRHLHFSSLPSWLQLSSYPGNLQIAYSLLLQTCITIQRSSNPAKRTLSRTSQSRPLLTRVDLGRGVDCPPTALLLAGLRHACATAGGHLVLKVANMKGLTHVHRQVGHKLAWHLMPAEQSSLTLNCSRCGRCRRPGVNVGVAACGCTSRRAHAMAGQAMVNLGRH